MGNNRPTPPSDNQVWAILTTIFGWLPLLMKKTLLSFISVFVMAASSVNAQSLPESLADSISSVLINYTLDEGGSASKALHEWKPVITTSQNEEAKICNGSRAIRDDLTVVGYNGSYGENGVDAIGFYNWEEVSFIWTLGRGFCEGYKGYKIVGFRFAVSASLGESALALCMVLKDNERVKSLASPFLDYYGVDLYDITDMYADDVDIKWNYVRFTDTYEIDDEGCDLVYGYTLKQVKGNGNTIAEYPVLVGYSKATDYDDMFLVSGRMFKYSQNKIYPLASEEDPMVPCFQIVLQSPDGETEIVSVDGSDKPVVAKEFYSADGTRLPVRQKGLNVVKMSDGSIRKIVVK